MKNGIRKNERYDIEVTDLNNLGYGVGRVGELVTFIEGAVDADSVSARVIHVTKTYAIAKTEKIITPSPHRIPDEGCTAKGCGGCAYRGITYEHELELKRRTVVSAFRKNGLPDVAVCPTVSTGKTEHYRNKAQYPVALSPDGTCRIGFYAPKSHRVIPAVNCPLQPAVFGRLLETVTDWIRDCRISVYNEETGEGLLRHLYLRASGGEREILLTLVINGRKLPGEDALIRRLREGFPEVVGLLVNINTEKTNVICGEEYRVLYGRGELNDTLCGVRLKLSPASFYQVNRDAAELLYTRAADLAGFKGDETLLDLFCGVGSIGLSMARRVREVIGIEIVPDAVRCAKENAALNGITNAHFFAGDATSTDRLLGEAERKLGHPIEADIAVLDPPRKGVDENLLIFLAGKQIPKIVYISCNPETLARDVAALIPLGYRPGTVTPIDLFPRTGHVETVVLMMRENH